MATLFIGGVADGQRRDIPDDLPVYFVPVPGESVELMDAQQYRKAEFVTQGRTFTVYVLASMPTREAFAMLLSNYKPQTT